MRYLCINIQSGAIFIFLTMHITPYSVINLIRCYTNRYIFIYSINNRYKYIVAIKSLIRNTR